MGQWIKNLTAGRRTFADRLADRQSQTIPSEGDRPERPHSQDVHPRGGCRLLAQLGICLGLHGEHPTDVGVPGERVSVRRREPEQDPGMASPPAIRSRTSSRTT